jgi:hypothetical protein
MSWCRDHFVGFWPDIASISVFGSEICYLISVGRPLWREAYWLLPLKWTVDPVLTSDINAVTWEHLITFYQITTMNGTIPVCKSGLKQELVPQSSEPRYSLQWYNWCWSLYWLPSSHLFLMHFKMLSVADYLLAVDWSISNNKLERIWKEVGIA